MAEIAIERGVNRPDGPKEFHGWAVLPVHRATSDTRWVEESPLDDNRYHADIRMQLQDHEHGGGKDHEEQGRATEELQRNRQRQHGLELALAAKWEDAPAKGTDSDAHT